jgi:malonyl-CoA decarboxylase
MSMDASFRGPLQTLIETDGKAPIAKPKVAPPAAPTRLDPKANAILERLLDCVQEVGGPVSARTRAVELGRSYAAMPMAERRQMLELLAFELGPDPKAVAKAHTAYAKAIGTAEQWDAESRLRQATVSPRSKLLRQFNELPDGLKFLVDLRTDVLKALEDRPTLGVLDRELQSRLNSWFDVGFLELRRITWDSPAALLEKLIGYEAVHQIRSWTDLKNRLDSDRRCYAFFHPRMPQEPLIFVEVALTRGITRDIQSLLDESAPLLDTTEATTAIFYSISNTQTGLRGVSFGNFLLKRVIEALKPDLPKLKTYSTLSPLPTFRMWLDEQFKKRTVPLEKQDFEALAQATGEAASAVTLQQTLQMKRWSEDPALVEALRAPMTKLGVHFVTTVKQGKLPMDPVARFHLGNGARVERLNWVADISAKGFNQSYSMMVNYRYIPEAIEENVDRFSGDGEVVVGPDVNAA